jgi:GNAT superfamily N-acetyltransferase
MARTGHAAKMARAADARHGAPPDHAAMHARWHREAVIRLLRDGDVEVVQAVFDRVGERPRRARFGGAKPALSDEEAAELARVDRTHHVLVAYLDGDPQPAGLARLVRDGAAAEVAFEVADDVQGRGIGTALATMLAADARAAGILELRATVAADNPCALTLLARCARATRTTWARGEVDIVAALE